MRYQPMLAAPMKAGVVTDWSDWVAEEKMDGQRMLVEVNKGAARLFARPRGDGRQIERTEKVGTNLLRELGRLPDGVYDGELMGGDVSTDVSRLDLADKLWFVLFDCLQLGNIVLTNYPHEDRHDELVSAFASAYGAPDRVNPMASVRLVNTKYFIENEDDLAKFVACIWEREGEGVILKRRDSKYYSGLRAGQRGTPKCWIKIKRVVHDVVELVGFEKSKGSVMGRGAFAIMVGRDDEGNETTCKTRDDEMLAKFNAEWERVMKLTNGKPSTMRGPYGEHPSMGRKFVIEHYGRTRSGGYRGPVKFDRWEDE